MPSFDYRPGLQHGTYAWLPDAALVRQRDTLVLRLRRGSSVSGRIVESSLAPEGSVECVVLTRTGEEVRVSAPRQVRDTVTEADTLARYNRPHGIFTYGTLMRGHASHALLARHAPHIVGAHTIGRLLHLGHYPGLIGGSRRVHGELATLEDPAEALRAIDAHEQFLGYGEPGSLYRRVVVLAKKHTGTSAWAWAYRYLGAREGVPLIDSGDWRQR